MVDVPCVVKDRLLEAFSATATSALHAALVIDQASLRVLSRGMRMSELLHEVPHMTLVELLETPREGRAPAALGAAMDVVYFLEPGTTSLAAALADHEPVNGPPAYGGAVHFIFSRPLPDALFAQIRASSLVARIGTLRELNLHFVPLRKTAFSLNAPDALGTLYGPFAAPTRAAALRKLAEQICTVYGTLQLPLPRVRFSAEGHPVCRTFARLMEEMFATAAAERSLLPAVEAAAVRGGDCREKPRREGVLLLLDRSFDPVTPLLYDFSFEALAEGLGLLRAGRVVTGGTASGGAGARRERRGGGTQSAASSEVLLHESDPIWSDLRHRPFEEVPAVLSKHTQVFLEEHEEIVRAQRKDSSLSQAKQIEAARAQLAFGYRKRRDQLKVQEELVRHVTRMLLLDGETQTQLAEQLSLEQDVATGHKLESGGEMRHAEAIKRITQQLAAMHEREEREAAGAEGAAAVAHDVQQQGVQAQARAAESEGAGASEGAGSSSNVAPAHVLKAMEEGEEEGGSRNGAEEPRAARERTRLLALLTACRQPNDAQLAEVARSAALPSDSHVPVARAYTYMGLPLQPPPPPLPPPEGLMVPLRRHVPRLSHLLDALFEGSLSTTAFPFIDGDEAHHVTADPFATSEEVSALRKELVGSWAFRRRRDSRPGSEGGSSGCGRAPGLVVIVLGGACHAELRCIHERSPKLLFGCTALLTPLQYLKALEEMGSNACVPLSDARSVIHF